MVNLIMSKLILSFEKEKTLEFIKTNEEILRQDLEKYLSCSKKSINILKSLIDKGLIKKNFGKILNVVIFPNFILEIEFKKDSIVENWK